MRIKPLHRRAAIRSRAAARGQCRAAMVEDRLRMRAQLVGWVERSETHRLSGRPRDGFRKSSTHPTCLRGLLVDVRSAISGAAGNLVATGAIALINQLLGTGVPSA
jgi:hypothetical protein